MFILSGIADKSVAKLNGRLGIFAPKSECLQTTRLFFWVDTGATTLCIRVA